MTSYREHLTSIILCGGSARRLGGVQKSLLQIEGVPVIERILHEIAHLGEVLISANAAADSYQAYGKVVADGSPDQGPLAGIAACLQETSADLVLVIPGDCPDYTRALAELLLTSLSQADPDITAVCAHDGTTQQNLHLALRRDALESLQSYLVEGGRSVRGWLATERVCVCDASAHAGAFLDIDSTQDLRERLNQVSESSKDSHSRNR